MATPSPSTITFELSGISATLSTAISDAANSIKTSLVDAGKQATTVVSEQVSAGLNEQDENLDISGMRQQILANVEIRYPILAQSCQQFNGMKFIEEPKFYLITGGKDTAIFGCVVYSFAVPGSVCKFKDVLIDGPDAPTIFQALERLLDLTRQMLEENREKYAKEAEGMASCKGKGTSEDYYKP